MIAEMRLYMGIEWEYKFRSRGERLGKISPQFEIWR
jgi:hypothetical protein